MVLRRSLLLLIALLLPTIAFATTTYVVKKGDNLYDLSRKFGVSVEDIKTFNKLKSINLGIGDELFIPVSNKDGNNNYVVKSGDTVSEIAEKFGVKTNELKSANNLKNNNLQIGQSLYIPLQNESHEKVEVSKEVIEVQSVKQETEASIEVTQEVSNTYIVNKGDTLGEIAERHNVKTSELKNANNLKSHNLQIGQKLTIPSKEVATTRPNKNKETTQVKSSDSSKNTSNAEMTVSNVYIIMKGDTIYDLSSKFNISKDNLKKWNGLDNNNLSIGQKLYLTPNKEAAVAKAKSQPKPNYTGTYKVKSGDTLGHIAVKHGISVSKLKAANDLQNNNLSVGKVLKVPSTQKSDSTVAKNVSSKYTVKKGDTLGGIANRHGISVAKIKQANSLNNNNIRVGQVLRIPGIHEEPVEKLTGSKYTVVRGDTLSQIAARYAVSVKDLRKANSLKSNYLYAGMKLVIPGNTVIATDPKPKTKSFSQTINTKYIVKKGDTLGIIAQNTGISVTTIKNMNNLKSNNIRQGQILVLPQSSTNYRAHTGQTAGASNQNSSEIRVKQNIIETAKQYLGAPYKFGGYSFKTGIDCSGYVKKIFSKFNVDLPRTARDIYYRAGTRVAKSQLQTGDLVFFTTYAKYPSHVGIYMGNGMFIHASSGARKVSITSLDKDYYRKRYIGAKRIKMSAIFENEYSQK